MPELRGFICGGGPGVWLARVNKPRPKARKSGPKRHYVVLTGPATKPKIAAVARVF